MGTNIAFPRLQFCALQIVNSAQLPNIWFYSGNNNICYCNDQEHASFVMCSCSILQLRALDDIKESIKELEYYRKAIFK